MKHCILFFLSFWCLQAQAQSIVNSSGGTHSIGSNTYSYSVGEMCAVHTSATASIIVTNGLLQPTAEEPNGISESWLESDQVNLYPNPSVARVYVEINTDETSSVELILLDMTGRQVVSKKGKLNSGTNRFEFDLSHLANSHYVLQIHLHKSKNDYSKLFKVQKIK